ncbi:hypothetical protein CHS0354_010737 [Potamilus streckersoni]|nr:hypothetical protein CHS0354_010737 [Potamilus streckersoni]
MRIRIKVQQLNIASAPSDLLQMGLLRLCVTFLTILLQINLVYSTVACPSGDTSGIIKNGKTCSQLISSTNDECYDATIETTCCASCNAIARGISGCQYGNKVDNCILVLCPYYTDPSECCSTCLTTATTMTTTTTTTLTRTTTTTTTTTASTTTTATTITTNAYRAENITTGSTSLASSSLSTSTGVIAGAVVGSIAATGLMVGLTYRLVCFSTG